MCTSFDRGKLRPGFTDGTKQTLNLDQWLFGLLVIGFAKAIDHVFIQASKLKAHLGRCLVIQSRAEFHQHSCRPRDVVRSLGDLTALQMLARVIHTLNGALISQLNELQWTRGINLGVQKSVGVVSGHGSLQLPYRTKAPVLRCFPVIAVCMMVCGISLLTAQPPANAPVVKKESPAAKAAEPPVVAAPPTSADEMVVSVDKQRASIRLQVGDGGDADSFFTTPWSTARAIPLPLTCDPMPEVDIIPLVKDAAAAQDLSAILIRSVIRRESASLWCAVSDKGAVGLMQLMPDTATQFGVDPYDPKQNIQAGSKYLKQLMTRYKGDTSLALAAYNAGPTVVDAAGGIPAIPETAAYVAAILKDVASRAPALPVAPKPE